MESISIHTPSRNAFVEITDDVQRWLSMRDFRDGILMAFVPHTTAGITLNENADPNVISDMLNDLERLAPRNQGYYRHREGNSSSHLRASLVGFSVVVPIEAGRLKLGTWQGIYLGEFDGPRQRRILLQVIPA
jgi:secondary thiamine-phosphate synthase enzyme